MSYMGSVKTTKYEIGFFGPEGSKIADLGMTARKTKRSLFLAMLENGPEILRYASLPEGDAEGFEWNTKAKAWMWNGFAIRFTGETKAH
jgi:hypothetical protein